MSMGRSEAGSKRSSPTRSRTSTPRSRSPARSKSGSPAVSGTRSGSPISRSSSPVSSRGRSRSPPASRKADPAPPFEEDVERHETHYERDKEWRESLRGGFDWRNRLSTGARNTNMQKILKAMVARNTQTKGGASESKIEASYLPKAHEFETKFHQDSKSMAEYKTRIRSKVLELGEIKLASNAGSYAYSTRARSSSDDARPLNGEHDYSNSSSRTPFPNCFGGMKMFKG